MIELNEELHHAIVEAGSEPVRLIDPATKREYVIMLAVEYDRVKSAMSDGDWPAASYLAAFPVLARDGWNDPRMDVYDALDPRRNE